jgi:hypothetical protein
MLAIALVRDGERKVRPCVLPLAFLTCPPAPFMLPCRSNNAAEK